jgi:hypothetical protein
LTAADGHVTGCPRAPAPSPAGVAPAHGTLAAMLLSLLAAALASEPAAGAPPCRTPWAEVAPTLDGLDAAWGISEASFRAGFDRLEAALPCLAEVVTPAAAARIHRAQGLDAFLHRDLDRARAAFAAARAADPAYTFPVTMVPEANPVRKLYDSATPTDSTTRLPPPARSVVWLDGVATRERPTDRATLFQLDTPMRSEWLAPPDPPPAYRARGQGFRLPLLLAGGATGATSAGLYLVADARTRQVPTSETDLQDIGAGNRRLVVTSASLGAVALGCVTTALVWGRW